VPYLNAFAVVIHYEEALYHGPLQQIFPTTKQSKDDDGATRMAVHDSHPFVPFRRWFIVSFISPRGLLGCKNRPAPFPGRMSYRRLNQALSFLSLSLGFF